MARTPRRSGGIDIDAPEDTQMLDIDALERQLAVIDVAISRAKQRQDAAVDAGDERTVVLEQAVIDRREAERLDLVT